MKRCTMLVSVSTLMDKQICFLLSCIRKEIWSVLSCTSPTGDAVWPQRRYQSTIKGGSILTRGPDIYGRLSWRNPPEKFCFWQTVQTCIREEKSLFRASKAKGIIAHPNERINKVHRGIQSSGKQLIMRMQSLRLDSYTKTCQPGLTLKLFL